MPRYVNVASVLFFTGGLPCGFGCKPTKNRTAPPQSGNSAGFVDSRRKPCKEAGFNLFYYLIS
jgi:hypothetical protein